MERRCYPDTIALALGLVALTACVTAQSGLKTVYYQVPGTTSEEINDQIVRRGAQDDRALGNFETRMTPSVKTVRENGLCGIGSTEVDLVLVVTLPQFSQLNKADLQTWAAYERLRTYAEWYQQQRVEISKRYAKKIEESLAQMPSQKNCQKVLNEGRARFKRLFKEHDRAQQAFDESQRGTVKRRLQAVGINA